MADGLSRFDVVRMSRFHRWVLILISLGEFVDGYDLIVMSGALLFLVPQFHLTAPQVGLLGAAAFIGAALGAVVFGNMTDKVGRRVIFMFNLVLFVGFALLSAFVTNIPELFITRFFVGVAVGADIPTSMAFLAEATPKAQRGAWVGYLPNISWTVGAMVSVGVALALLHSAGPDAWRWMFGLAAAPALLILIGRRILPESPRWLIKQGRPAEAKEVLQRFGIVDPDLSAYQAEHTRFTELFTPQWRARTIASSGVYGINCLAAGLATVASPFVFRYVGLVSVEDSLIFTGLIWVVALLGVLTGFKLTDRIGRRRLAMRGCWIPMAVAGIIMGLYGQGRPDVLVPCYLIYSYANWIGSGCVWVWPGELVPTRIRGASNGVANVFCRVALASSIFVIPVGIAVLGFKLIVVLLASVLFVNVIIVWRYRFFETKGLSLEELTASANTVALPPV